MGFGSQTNYHWHYNRHVVTGQKQNERVFSGKTKTSAKLFLSIVVLTALLTTIALQIWRSEVFAERVSKYEATNRHIMTSKLDQQVFKAMKQNNFREYIPDVKVNAINCRLLSYGDKSQLERAEKYQKLNPRIVVSDKEYISLASDCKNFIQSRKYTMLPVTKDEETFSIAFALVVFKDVEQVERLLRAVYRPQNYYCIHLDSKASENTRRALELIVGCFDNVFLTSRSVNVRWGHFSVLEPDLMCMEELWWYKKWKYFINLTGQEFPLHTNGDIVKVIKALNGSNAVEGVFNFRNKERFVKRGRFFPFLQKQTPLPIDAQLVKGAIHIVAQRGFVDFILHNEGALAFRNWLKDKAHPDETLFSSLNYSPNLKAPGAYLGDPNSFKLVGNYPKSGNLYFHRFKNWGDWPCHGKYVRSVCVFGIGDLPLLSQRQELYVNKLYIDYHPLLYDCLEERLYSKTLQEFLGDREFDASFYASLDQVKNHVHDVRWL